MSYRERLSWLRFTRRRRPIFAVVLCWFAAGVPVWAGGPRWVTGPPFFSTSGTPVVWYTNQPLYFTDPGDLSSTVNHAAADALVAAAAGVWNVPTASLVLAQGGSLAEHVSGANTFLGPSGLIFPTDVQSGNYLAKQIAIIYDTDGSTVLAVYGPTAYWPVYKGLIASVSKMSICQSPGSSGTRSRL